MQKPRRSLILLLGRYLCPIFTVFVIGRQTWRQPVRNSSICYYPLHPAGNIPILISLGSNLGGMLLLWRLTSVQLVRVSDEPGLGTTDNCCTFTSKGRKKGRKMAEAVFIRVKYRESLRSKTADVVIHQEERKAGKYVSII